MKIIQLQIDTYNNFEFMWVIYNIVKNITYIYDLLITFFL